MSRPELNSELNCLVLRYRRQPARRVVGQTVVSQWEHIGSRRNARPLLPVNQRCPSDLPVASNT